MILLTGGTGLLGSRVLALCLAMQWPVRVFTRGATDWRSDSVPHLKRLGAEPFLGDLRDGSKIEAALEGCNVVVNMAGTMRQTKQLSFQEIHVEAVKSLVNAANKLGVQRFIHVSCLGSETNSDSEYFRSKWQGEQIVKQGQFYWTIIRPSFMFGESFILLDILEPILKNSPVVPVLGTGLNQVQPVWVEDVAACIMQSIYDKSTADKCYDLVGPKAYSWRELMLYLCESLGKPKPAVQIPALLAAKALAPVEKFLPNSPIGKELVQLLQAESCADPAPMQASFSVQMLALEEHLERQKEVPSPVAEEEPAEVASGAGSGAERYLDTDTGMSAPPGLGIFDE